ncbi:MAG: rRNA maturation RNase YbeY [Bdellovibrionaceae bacterium]|nr:rRNA maturation RNase YbeY [Pseudobdellovibrionaceae bacterium]
MEEEFLFWLFDQLKKHLLDAKVETLALEQELGVILVEEDDMRALNLNYRGRHYATDVLSFAMEAPVLGEIVLCPDVIVKQAVEHELHPSQEFTYLFLHGVLHLLGYDHEKDVADAEEMFAIQDKVFENLMAEDIVEKFVHRQQGKV